MVGVGLGFMVGVGDGVMVAVAVGVAVIVGVAAGEAEGGCGCTIIRTAAITDGLSGVWSLFTSCTEKACSPGETLRHTYMVSGVAT